MRTLFCLLLVSLVSVHAQTANEEPRKSLVFPPGAKEPQASPTPAPKISNRTPSETLDTFFLSLKAGQVDAAYDALTRNTIIADRREDVTALKEKTKQALDSYGPANGYEVVDEQTVGTMLMRRTCISLNDFLPLRWRFYFYKSGGEWRLVDLRVDDALVELFEEAGHKRR